VHDELVAALGERDYRLEINFRLDGFTH
jgi:hypothetical protein